MKKNIFICLLACFCIGCKDASRPAPDPCRKHLKFTGTEETFCYRSTEITTETDSLHDAPTALNIAINGHPSNDNFIRLRVPGTPEIWPDQTYMIDSKNSVIIHKSVTYNIDVIGYVTVVGNSGITIVEIRAYDENGNSRSLNTRLD